MIFEELDLWFDPVARSGPEAMAVDEYLLGRVARPLLRIYCWRGDWASFGYFGKWREARAAFPGTGLVRRWTGGGTVDHRGDWTYSLMIPAGSALAGTRGAESYRRIHEALAECLRREGLRAGLAQSAAGTGALCFENPVEFDVTDGGARKIAGAAQRRSKAGLLHQGSVSCTGEGLDRATRGRSLADCLARSWREVETEVDPAEIGRLAETRYAAAGWLEKC